MPISAMEEIANGSGIPYVNVKDVLSEHKDEYIYYRTDHHWTTLGAYYGYIEYCRSAGYEPVDINALEEVCVTDDFHGTYSSKVNLPFEKGDEIHIYNNPECTLTVTYDDTNEVTNSLYNLDYVQAKDKYSLFLNNLHTLITVENDNARTDGVLLVIKDSYANSMIPFLAYDYQTIYILDTRYYKFGPTSFVEDHEDITDILLLYNMGTIDTDTGIRGIF